MPNFTLPQLIDIAHRSLVRAGAGEAMAATTARALVAAEAQGLSSHGMGRLPQYALHLRNGRADGKAVPHIVKSKRATVLVDAGTPGVHVPEGPGLDPCRASQSHEVP